MDDGSNAPVVVPRRPLERHGARRVQRLMDTGLVGRCGRPTAADLVDAVTGGPPRSIVYRVAALLLCLSSIRRVCNSLMSEIYRRRRRRGALLACLAVTASPPAHPRFRNGMGAGPAALRGPGILCARLRQGATVEYSVCTAHTLQSYAKDQLKITSNVALIRVVKP